MKKYIRYGVDDVVLSEKEVEQLDSKYCVKVVGKDGNTVRELELYWVADEDEDGNEVE